MSRVHGSWLLLLLACSSPPRPTPPAPPPCEMRGLGGGPPDGVFRVTNEDATVRMQHPMVCPTDFEVTATVAVLGPRNDEVPLAQGTTKRAVTGDGTNVLETPIVFRPPATGSYHLTARFDPNLGLSQRDIFVGENRLDAGAELVVPGNSPLASCTLIDVTEGGLPLCLTPPVRLFDRAGNVVHEFSSAYLAARVGTVLWLLEDPDLLTRWVETDGGFVAAPDGGIQHGLVHPVMAADARGAMLAMDSSILWVDATGAIERKTTPMPGPPTAAWTAQERWAVFVDLGGRPMLCAGSTRDAGTCTDKNPFIANVAGSSPDGIWYASAASNMFTQSMSLLTDGPERSLTIPRRNMPLPNPLPWNAVPFFYEEAGHWVLTATGDELGIEKFPNHELLSVTHDWVALRDPATGNVLLYRR